MEEINKGKERGGKIASIVGIIVNLLLALSKIIVGVIFGVISVMADGLNNLTDCGSSIVSFVSFKISSKPADSKHPYGHERMEYVSSLIVSFLIVIIAFELFKESIDGIFSPRALDFSYIVIVILILSICVKCGLYFYNKYMAVKINSDILRATAVDSLSDCISTSIVLLAMLIGKWTGFNIDGYAGLIVAIFIFVAGVKILLEMTSKLIGQAPDKEVTDSIKDRIKAHKDIIGIHDLNVYNYGPNKYFASVHMELDADLDTLVAHEIIDEVEREFLNETNIVLTGHYDPIVVDDDEVGILREMVMRMVKELNENYSMHDFRMVKGPHKTNIIFEVAVPLDTKQSNEEIINFLKEKIAGVDEKYMPVIVVEKQRF